MASQEKERAKQKGEKFSAKLYLIRKLYERGYKREEVEALFKFIDWVLQLSDEDEELIGEEIKQLEEVKKMPYVTSVERIGIKKGLQQGLQQGLQRGLLEDSREMILEALDERFGEAPFFVSDAVNRIEDRDVLKLIHRRAIRCASLEEFEQALNGQR
ncbi:MAG: hypothetical protein QME81_16990 [bacterium]|nr:hypothetical protein [bacterium]